VDTAKRIYKDELVVTDANGRYLRTLVWFGPWRGDPQIPVWFPDGKQLAILFRTHPGEDISAARGSGANLYTIDRDGTRLRQLTHFTPYERVDMGSFSPDGKFIAFETSAGAVGGTLPDVVVMNADGTHLGHVTHTRNFETQADWGPGR